MTAVFAASHAILWLLVVGQGLLIFVLVRELWDLRQRAHMGAVSIGQPIPAGVAAPEFSAIDLRTGQAVHSTRFRGKRTLLLFLSTECGDCRKLATELSREAAVGLTGLVIYCDGTRRGCQNQLSKVNAAVPTLVKDRSSIANIYRLSNFPAAVVVDEAWRIEGFRYPTRADDLKQCLARQSPTSEPELLPL